MASQQDSVVVRMHTGAPTTTSAQTLWRRWGETEVTMQLLLWAGWSRFGPLMELVWWAWASGVVLGQVWSFVSLCFLVRLCLGFWIGISPSSFGRGFECRFLVNVLLRWCYS